MKIHHILILLPFLLSGCFTGVESTKKINITREERKALQPAEEDTLLASVRATPLKEWKRGKRFIAADNKTLLIFDQRGLENDPEKASIGGKEIFFESSVETVTPSGNRETVLLFSDGRRDYRYNTKKSPAQALVEVTGVNIPMMIDADMLAETAGILEGKKLWTRSPLWYDKDGNKIEGRKFVGITVNEIMPGNIIFPVKLHFTDELGNDAYMFMNFGNSGTDSRAFSNLFYLSDIKSRYPAIDLEVWDLICRGKVRNGMTKEECKLSLGNPKEVGAGHDYSRTIDIWQYDDGTLLMFSDGILTDFKAEFTR